ncbi:MAG: ArsR/SmtB family transcription factor [Salinibacter sp.]
MPPLIPPDDIEAVARRFRLLSEPVRLELLNALHDEGEMTVGDLADATGQQQANVSKHLKRMAEAGLLRRSQEGVYVYYALADPTLAALCQLVRARLQGELASGG